MRGRTLKLAACVVALILLSSGGTYLLRAGAQGNAQASAPERQDWAAHGGGPLNDHYSPLTQINRENVDQLQVAWTFDTGEPGGLQSSPLIVDGVLYGITPTQKIFALDAATGVLRWKFDSGIKGAQPDRGLAYWSD